MRVLYVFASIAVLLTVAAPVTDCPGPGYGGHSSCVLPNNISTFTTFPINDVRNDIIYYFPSGRSPVPEFISDARAVPTITLTQAGPLRVSFMYEGAGYRNQLGYFTFDNSGVGGAPVKLTEALLFPDINDACVTPGMQVTTQDFPAGTKIGFYLISDGCNAGPNAPKFYSISSFNTADHNVRHIGAYLDYFRELLIIGFEDLVGLGDKDYEDTMFILDGSNLFIDWGNIAKACTGPVCANGGTCDYDTADCDCGNTKFYGFHCEICNCTDNNDCTTDTCQGPQLCIAPTWDTQAQNANCLNSQSCGHANTGCPTTSVPTTAIPTTRAPTTGVPTTQVPTTRVPTTRVPTTAVPTTQVPTTAQATTGAVDTQAQQTGTNTGTNAGTNAGTNGSNTTSTNTMNNSGFASIGATTGLDTANPPNILESGASTLFMSLALLLSLYLVL
jgi:hypothetical protein